MDRNKQIMTIIFNLKSTSENKLFHALTILLDYNAHMSRKKIGWASAVFMMADILRRWTNIKPTLVQCLVFATCR